MRSLYGTSPALLETFGQQSNQNEQLRQSARRDKNNYRLGGLQIGARVRGGA
jgi:hypothetical protein